MLEIKLENRIFDILEEKGISINKLANDLDLSYATIYNIVKKETLDTITLNSIVKIAHYLGTGVEEMFEKKVLKQEYPFTGCFKEEIVGLKHVLIYYKVDDSSEKFTINDVAYKTEKYKYLGNLHCMDDIYDSEEEIKRVVLEDVFGGYDYKVKLEERR